MSVHETNPAGRLWLFLAAIESSPREAQLRTTWENHLGTRVPVEYFERLAGIVSLPQKIREAVDALLDSPIPAEDLTVALDPVIQTIMADPNGSQNVAWFMSHVSSGYVQSLKTCSYLLARSTPAAEIPQETIATVRAMAEDIVTTVASDQSLDKKVRETVLDYAHRLIRACDSYVVGGPQAFQDELDRFLGVVVSSDIKERVPTSLWVKVSAVAGAVLMALGIYNGSAEAIESTQTYTQIMQLPYSVEAPGEILIKPAPHA